MEGYFSILGVEDDTVSGSNVTNGRPKAFAQQPDFLIDFNLDQVINLICEDYDEKVRMLFYHMPQTKAVSVYRQAVYADIRKPGHYDAMKHFVDMMHAREEYRIRINRVAEPLQKNVWYIREIDAYCKGVQYLTDCLHSETYTSKGMGDLRQFMEAYCRSAEYRNICDSTEQLRQELENFRILLTYEKNRFSITEGKGHGEYDDFLKEVFPRSDKKLKSPYLSSFDLSDVETEVLRLFLKKHSEYFIRLNEFCRTKSVYWNENVLRLVDELSYYLSYSYFEDKMIAKGLQFAPVKMGGDTLSARGLYDLALAITNLENDKEIVSNDTDLFDNENFFVLTGPNQGGKTTFARSLGQLVYLTKMGFDAPCISATVPYYSTILTHFSVEESSESGRGKLMEELERLKPMMNQNIGNAFVVINELFTTAANYDALIMGQKVLTYFIESGCKGIYVTHLNELSKCHNRIVSLRACVDELENQTYKIDRNPAKELAGANKQVEKYKLTYQQIKERFQ